MEVGRAVPGETHGVILKAPPGLTSESSAVRADRKDDEMLRVSSMQSSVISLGYDEGVEGDSSNASSLSSSSKGQHLAPSSPDGDSGRSADQSASSAESKAQPLQADTTPNGLVDMRVTTPEASEQTLPEPPLSLKSIRFDQNVTLLKREDGGEEETDIDELDSLGGSDSDSAVEHESFHYEGSDDASDIAKTLLSIRGAFQSDVSNPASGSQFVCNKCGRRDLKTQSKYRSHRDSHKTSINATFKDGVSRTVCRKTDQDGELCGQS